MMRKISMVVKSCGDCPFYDWGLCKQLGRNTDEDTIPSDCPLDGI